MKCAGCLKVIKDSTAIKCSTATCENCYCSLCIGFTSMTTERKKSWKCPECSATMKKGGDNSLTPVRSGSENQNITLRKKSEPVPEPTGMDVIDLTVELRQLTRQFAALGTRIEEVTESLSHCHGRMDEIVEALKATDVRIKRLEQRDQEVLNLKITIGELKSELSQQAQSALRNEIEISGIPETSHENLQHTVLVAAKKLGVDLEDRDLDYITRVGPVPSPIAASTAALAARMPRPVVVRLVRRIKRDQILKAAKSRRNIHSTDLEISGAPIKVYFNERLTREKRYLFRDARIRAKKQGWFCWVSQGAIYVREREGRPSQAIRVPGDLDRLLPAEKLQATPFTVQ